MNFESQVLKNCPITHTDPQSAKKTDNLTVVFALLGSLRSKAACRAGISNSKCLAGRMRLKARSGGPH